MNEQDAGRYSEHDVVVVGSGAGGLSAALTARKHGLDVVVIEKEPYFGGTTARSGGVLWLPCNPVSQAAGVTDNPDAARTYLQHEAGNFFDPERVDAFLREGPQMVDFFVRESEVKFDAVPGFADYHPTAPGGVPGGRSIIASAFDGRALGKHIEQLRPPLREITFVGMMINSSREVQQFFNVTRSLSASLYVARRLVQHAREMLVHGRPMRLTNGNALAARLAKSLFDLGVSIQVSTPARELATAPDGSISGVWIDGPDGPVLLRARRGVVLACGGFPHDKDRRKVLFPHAPTGEEHLSPAPPGNTGDGLRLAEGVGGITDDALPNAAAWIPVSRVQHRNGTSGVFPHLIDRYKPGIIAVSRRGRRFVNESDSYHDFGQSMIRTCQADGDSETVAWLICDHRAIRRYGLGFVKPFPLPITPHLRSGYLLRSRTVEELATQAGIDPAGLGRTIDALNGPARQGLDPEFGKGSTAYNRYLGDPEHKPNPCVAPVDRAPFYAVKVILGDLGTFAGLKTDRHARVLSGAGLPIPGLYTVGNDMASIMGGSYPGGGITLGPAMTFGYIAGKHLAGMIE